MIDEKWKKLLSPQRLGDDREQGLVRGEVSIPGGQRPDCVLLGVSTNAGQDAGFSAIGKRLCEDTVDPQPGGCVNRPEHGGGSGSSDLRTGDLGDYHPSDFGAIVATAALAHDIGNPPFGHSGEDAIRHWFVASPVASRVAGGLSEAQRRDFEAYEGNAEGFRILTRLQFPDNRGGMQLTCATLAAFTKYPVESTLGGKKGKASRKKFGFFQSEIGFFEEVAEATGLKREAAGCNAWTRHPLA